MPPLPPYPKPPRHGTPMEQLRHTLTIEAEHLWRHGFHSQRFMKQDPCVYCGMRHRSPSRIENKMSWDHIEPRALGHYDANNFARACQNCNTDKSHLSLLRYLVARLTNTERKTVSNLLGLVHSQRETITTLKARVRELEAQLASRPASVFFTSESMVSQNGSLACSHEPTE